MPVPNLIRALSVPLLAAPLLLTACGGDEASGFAFDMVLAGTGDNEEYSENLEYLLTFVEDSAQVNLAIGTENFASGQISGCQITYSSVVWGDERDGFEVRWRIDGKATYQLQSGCETQLPDGVDWDGEEVFVIVQSDHPEIPPGSTYTLLTSGNYKGEVGQ
tara:strand:- start:62 stop:547 length:486 start_codon:yes stop_codon:yes gene_type:complete